MIAYEGVPLVYSISLAYNPIISSEKYLSENESIFILPDIMDSGIPL